MLASQTYLIALNTWNTLDWGRVFSTRPQITRPLINVFFKSKILGGDEPLLFY